MVGDEDMMASGLWPVGYGQWAMAEVWVGVSLWEVVYGQG